MKRIARSEFAIVLGPLLVVKQKFEAAARAQPKMVLALRANFPVRFKVFFPDDRTAGTALDPQSFGADAAFIDGRRILDGLFSCQLR